MRALISTAPGLILGILFILGFSSSGVAAEVERPYEQTEKRQDCSTYDPRNTPFDAYRRARRSASSPMGLP